MRHPYFTHHTTTNRLQNNPNTMMSRSKPLSTTTTRRRQQPYPSHLLSLLLSLLLLAPIDAFFHPTSLSSPSSSSLSHTRLYAGSGNSLNREELRKSLVAEGLEDILAARAVEAADKAISIWETQVTDFCRPPEVATIQRVLGRVADLAIAADGGFPQAERQRVFFSRALDYEPDPEQEKEERAPFFQAISIEGNFIFDKATHRDFLGAILGTGINREKVGDILLQGERGAHVVVHPEVAEYVMTSLAGVRSAPVKNTAIPLSELGVRPPVTKEMTSVEASMRLDAVASAGMGMSRSKLKDMIESGDVLVNWKEITSANSQLKEGDIVTVRGKGRLEINEVEVTSKGKFRVKITKFV